MPTAILTTKGTMQVSTQYVEFDSLTTESGVTLSPVTVAYETYGRLNHAKSNAILVCHAFTGDAHAASNAEAGVAPGWWEKMIGPGRAFDTDRFFVICANILGGCGGTTGPSSLNPSTGEPYAMSFPAISMADIVRLQKRLIDHLGIERLLAVAGGSMGGMQALEWSVMYPEAVAACIPIATTARHSAQQIAFNEVGRQAIIGDPEFHGGNYYGGHPPAHGLSVARMIGHITYMSDESMKVKFGRRFRENSDSEFDVASYLKYRGNQFVDRFDANSYITITRAMDYFDLSAGYPSLGAALERATCRFLVISFTSDWLYPTYQSREIVSALRSRNREVAYCELTSRYGHDAFLIEVDEQAEVISGFLSSTFDRVLAA